MVADIAFHGGQEGHNPHPHLMLTTRTIGPEGFGKKDREWNKKEHVTTWRKDWADSANRALARAGRDERIDHRSLIAQRDAALRRGDRTRAETLDRDPQVRLGRAAWMRHRKGQDNDRTVLAREVDTRNDAREQERAALRDELRTLHPARRRESQRDGQGAGARPAARPRRHVVRADEARAGAAARRRSRRRHVDAGARFSRTRMTKSLNSQLDEAKREREETEAQKLALTKERFNVEDSYRTLAAKVREEAQLRERNIEVLKHERGLYIEKMLFWMVGRGSVRCVTRRGDG